MKKFGTEPIIQNQTNQVYCQTGQGHYKSSMIKFMKMQNNFQKYFKKSN